MGVAESHRRSLCIRGPFLQLLTAEIFPCCTWLRSGYPHLPFPIHLLPWPRTDPTLALEQIGCSQSAFRECLGVPWMLPGDLQGRNCFHNGIVWHYLPFPLSFSHRCAVEFSRGHMTRAGSSIWQLYRMCADVMRACVFLFVKRVSVLILNMENIDSYKPYKCKFSGVLNALRV